MNIGIVGGGASGMILASKLTKYNVTILERNSKLGKKLLLTGNGKCNFTNLNFDNLSSIYNNDFAIDIYKRYDNNSFINYFNSIGIVPKVEVHRGISYIYPNSNKSTSVYYCLLDKIISNKVNVEYNTLVNDIHKDDDSFDVICDNGKEYKFDKIILSTGGMTYKKTGSDGVGYELAKTFSHNITKLYPGLCSLRYGNNSNFLNDVKGIRVNARVIFEDFNEFGEIQFNDSSISGIPIMNLSNKICSFFDKDIDIILDFSEVLLKNDIDVLNDNYKKTNKDEILTILNNRKRNISYKKARDFLCGYLPDELNHAIIKQIGLDDKNVLELTKEDLITIIDSLVNFKINVKPHISFDDAQITIGGVDVNEIDKNTLESKLVKNLYFIGEILDIDGICGGYNLQLAYSTASIVADSILND